MASSLENYAQRTRYLWKRGTNLKRVPSDWNTFEYKEPDEIVGLINNAHDQQQRVILLLTEGDFPITLKMLRLKFTKGQLANVGIIVSCNKPHEFLTNNNTVPELMDVVPEKGLKQYPEFYLIKAIRQLLRKEERERRRIGQQTLETLNRVFITMSAERDPQNLLSTILDEAIELTSASAGTLYVTKEIDGELYLTLRIRKDEDSSISIEASRHKADETSLCGYVVLTGKLFNITDVDKTSPLSLPKYSSEIDHHRKNDPVTSVLTVPLKNSRNEIEAVMQLVNKKESAVLPFEAEDESILASLATQAAICLENVELTADIQKLFDGFSRASIIAIESRDPSTAGHSERVAKMTVALARATSEIEEGIYRSVVFKEQEVRELEYAALLHDFGKIGVREEVLVKAKKLYTYQLEMIHERFKVLKSALKIDMLEKQLSNGKRHPDFEQEYRQKIAKLESYWEFILQANEPSVMKKERMAYLDQVRAERLILADGTIFSLITEEEFEALSITRGTLTEAERIEVESHVRHTYQFLKLIPWTRDFKHLPEIAYCHHEKLDGTGYPRGLVNHEIPLQSKIMTIADIYDALTASDRWYKDAVPTEKALDILSFESKEGKIDPILFDIFIKQKIYLLTHPVSSRQVG